LGFCRTLPSLCPPSTAGQSCPGSQCKPPEPLLLSPAPDPATRGEPGRRRRRPLSPLAFSPPLPSSPQPPTNSPPQQLSSFPPLTPPPSLAAFPSPWPRSLAPLESGPPGVPACKSSDPALGTRRHLSQSWPSHHACPPRPSPSRPWPRGPSISRSR
jgi:hypothetical protein